MICQQYRNYSWCRWQYHLARAFSPAELASMQKWPRRWATADLLSHHSQHCIFYQVGVSERSLRRWSKTLEEEEMMVASQRGHHAKTISPIVDPDFREKFCSHVRSESCRKGNFCKCDENRSSTKEKKNLPKLVLQLCLNFFLFRTAPSHNCNTCKVGQF